MTKVLITGAAGFIGYHMASTLANKPGYSLVLVDNLERGRMDDEFKALLDRDNVTFVSADLTQSEAVDALPKDVEYIYHFAAVIGVKNVMENPDKVLKVNAVSTLNILDFSASISGLKRFTFASTSELYAGTQRSVGIPLPTPESTPFTVDDFTSPRTTYALSKAYGESSCYTYAQLHGVPVTLIRFFNVYGPRMGFMHVIPELFYKFQTRTEIDVASPTHSRAFCYVQDAVDMVCGISEHDAGRGEVFNVGNAQEEISILELVETIKTLLNKPDTRLHPGAVTEGSPVRRCPDTSNIDRVLTIPRTSLEDGLKKTYDWYQHRLHDKYE